MAGMCGTEQHVPSARALTQQDDLRHCSFSLPDELPGLHPQTALSQQDCKLPGFGD